MSVKRVQYKRGTKLPPNTKLVTRRTKKWGNPYRVIPWGKYTLEESLKLYRGYIKWKLELDPDFFLPLKGFNLACSCPLDQDCHADIIMEVLYR